MARKTTGRRPKPGTPDLIMSLPPEIRNRIYELALIVEDGVVHLHHYQKSAQKNLEKHTTLLLASKAIRSEALPLFLGGNAIMYHLDPFTRETCVKAAEWLRRVALEVGRAPFKRDFRFGVHAVETWRAVVKIYPIVEMIRETGLILCPGTERNAYMHALKADTKLPPALTTNVHGTVFRLLKSRAGRLQQKFELGVDLGESAAREGWTKERLNSEFMPLLDKASSSSGRKTLNVEH